MITDLLETRLRKSVRLTSTDHLCTGCGRTISGMELEPLPVSALDLMPPPSGSCPNCGSFCWPNVLGDVLGDVA